MEHNYYAILGVPETADAATIRDAFLRRARECHPDRGGSHAQMVLLNQAWEVLSHADSRRRYDALRTGRADAAQAASFDQDMERARKRAEEYPLDWATFEKWLQSAARDFTSANYGKSVFDLETPQGGTLNAFIAGGVFIGLVFGILLAVSVGYPQGLSGWRSVAGAVVFYAFIGGLLGKGLHYVIASGLHLAGVGAAGGAMKVTEIDLWKLVSATAIGAIGLLLIGSRAEMKIPVGLNRDEALRSITDALWQNVRYGGARGAFLGALFGYALIGFEAKRTVYSAEQRKSIDGVSGSAALVGGIAFSIAGAICAFFGFLHGLGVGFALRAIVGAVLGALICGIALVLTKKTILRESLRRAEAPVNASER